MAWKQVRLPESDTAIDEQRVVRQRRCLGDGARGGVGELVARSDDVASRTGTSG